jgi:hypothetical protein
MENTLTPFFDEIVARVKAAGMAGKAVYISEADARKASLELHYTKGK